VFSGRIGRTKMEIDEKVIAELIKGYKGPEDLVGENGLLKQRRGVGGPEAFSGKRLRALGGRAFETDSTTHEPAERSRASRRPTGCRRG
jgi:hypothetical protein